MRTRPVLVLVLFAAALPSFGQGIPAQWHQPLTPQETAWASRMVAILKSAQDFPKVKIFHVFPGASPEMQFNAWEQNMEVYIPVEIFRFIESDPNAFAFLVAHEAGHAKQEEIYGQSCYTASNVTMSQLDWDRAVRDIAGGAAAHGAAGAAHAAANAQKQACEDNADAWAVRFTREAGLDPAGGVHLFSKLMQISADLNWQPFTEQFTSDHSISEERIAHITALISQKQ